MMLGAAGLAVDIFAQSVTRHRTAAGSFVNGVWTPGAVSSTVIAAVVQAAKREDLQAGPEGESVEGDVTIYTRADLRTSNEDGRTPADEFTTTTGERYKVVRIMARPEGGFTRALARRSDDRGRRV
jgi:hypothetical protein